MSKATSIPFSRIKVPLPIVVGNYELLTNEELRDHIADCNAEQDRRLAKKGPAPVVVDKFAVTRAANAEAYKRLAS